VNTQPTAPLDEDVLRGWIGRQSRSADTASAGPLRLLAATLDRALEGGLAAAVPPLWHWLAS
jgi:3-methylfumaryl-CoA hydratase